jgi:hypothetical protein
LFHCERTSEDAFDFIIIRTATTAATAAAATRRARTELNGTELNCVRLTIKRTVWFTNESTLTSDKCSRERANDDERCPAIRSFADAWQMPQLLPLLLRQSHKCSPARRRPPAKRRRL